MLSVIIPVYRNYESLPEMCENLVHIQSQIESPMEVVFVVDASPDASYNWLSENLPHQPFASQLLLLSRNFGEYAAIRAGLTAARGHYFANISADLQEPPHIVVDLYRELLRGHDIALGVRETRTDPFISQCFAKLFWWIYRRLIQKQMPKGGLDIFAFTHRVRDHLLALGEHNSTLVGLLLWLGYSRASIPYERLPRKYGKSSWSVRRKLRYMTDSMLAFSDLPMQLLILFGLLSLLGGGILSLGLFAAVWGWIAEMPDYTSHLALILLLAGVNALGLGVIGSYVWRTFENTKGRPPFIVAQHMVYDRQGAGVR